MSEINSLERVISLTMLLMERKRGWTKSQIFERIQPYREAKSDDAKNKMFERDKNVLRSLGLSLHVEDPDEDNSERYLIPEDTFALQDLEFTPPEQAALAAVFDFWRGGFGQSSQRALGRLDTASGAELWENKSEQGNPFQVQAGQIDEDTFADIATAIAEQRSITFRYRSARAEDSTRNIAPWALLQSNAAWYVCGWDHDRDAKRYFKLSRFRGSVQTTATDYVVSPENPRELVRELIPQETYPPIELRANEEERRLIVSRLYGHKTEPTPAGFLVTDPDYQTLWDLMVDDDIRVSFAPADHPMLDDFVQQLQHLGAAIDEAIETYSDQTGALTPIPATRRRSNVADEMRLVFDMISFIYRRNGATHKELQERFSLKPAQLKKKLEKLPLYGLPDGLPDELFELMDDGEVVTVRQVDAVSKPLSLNPVEAITTLLGLEMLSRLRPDIASAAQSALSKIRQALTTRSFDRLSEFIWWDDTILNAAQHQLQDIREAIDTNRTLELNYGNDPDSRLVSPVVVREYLNDFYILAWCHRSDGPRVFRLGRCHQLAMDAERTLSEEQHTAVLNQEIFSVPPTSKTATYFADYQITDYLPAMSPTHQDELDGGDVLMRVPRVSDNFLVQAVLAQAPKLLVVEPADLVVKTKQRIQDRLELLTNERA